LRALTIQGKQFEVFPRQRIIFGMAGMSLDGSTERLPHGRTGKDPYHVNVKETI